MKAFFLVKHGSPSTAFVLREAQCPVPKENEVLIKTEAFGLNFADVMARLGKYQDAPPLPFVPGYEVVGRVEAVGKNVKSLSGGQRVVAFTRFGGYAEYAAADHRVVQPVPEDMDAARAAALATQYCTAWYCAEEMVKLNAGDRVMIHAAAGGVGIALVQLAKRRGCIVYGTCGSDEKVSFLKKLGADHAINYSQSDFPGEIKKTCGPNGLDVIFDPIGGKNFSKGRKLLGAGGRIVGLGVSEQLSGGLFPTLRMVFNFGLLPTVLLLVRSQGIIGVNMLRIADSRPEVLQRCMKNVTGLAASGELDPHSGGIFPAEKLAEAHALLGSRRSVGKIAVKW